MHKGGKIFWLMVGEVSVHLAQLGPSLSITVHNTHQQATSTQVLQDISLGNSEVPGSDCLGLLGLLIAWGILPTYTHTHVSIPVYIYLIDEIYVLHI